MSNSDFLSPDHSTKEVDETLPPSLPEALIDIAEGVKTETRTRKSLRQKRARYERQRPASSYAFLGLANSLACQPQPSFLADSKPQSTNATDLAGMTRRISGLSTRLQAKDKLGREPTGALIIPVEDPRIFATSTTISIKISQFSFSKPPADYYPVAP